MKKVFLLPLLVLCACGKPYPLRTVEPFGELKLEKRTIAVDFEPLNTFRYGNHLLITQEELPFRFAAFDLDHGYLDEAFQRKLNADDLYGLMNRNDQLYGYFGSSKWKIWKNGKWKKSTSEYDYFFSQIAVRPYQNNLVYLGEDADYFIYGINIGEFGGSVLFRNKKTKKTYSFQQTGPVDVLKTTGGYVVSMSLPHSEGFVTIATIKDPRKLELVPDSLDLIRHAFKLRSTYDFWEANQLKCLAPGMVLRRFLVNEINFRENAYTYYSTSQKEDPNIDMKLDSMGYGTRFLCAGSFLKKREVTYLLQDSTLFLGQFNDQKLKVVQRFSSQKQLPYDVLSRQHKGTGSAFGLKQYSDYEEDGLFINAVGLSVEQERITIYSIINSKKHPLSDSLKTLLYSHPAKI